MIKMMNYYIYFIVLCIIYSSFVSPLYGYAGFKLDIDYLKVLISLLTIFLLFLASKKTGLIAVYHSLFICVYLVPLLVFFSFAGRSYEYFSVNAVCALLVFLITRYGNIKEIKTFTVSRKMYMYTLSLIVLVYLLLIVRYGGLRYLNFDISKVYDFRREAAEILPSSFAYLSPWIAKFILPITFVLAIVTKNRTLLLYSFTCSILIFALTAHKAPLFYPVVIAINVYLYSRYKYDKLIPALFVVIAIIGLMDFYLNSVLESGSWGWFGSLFIRRTLFVPSLMNDYFVSYFSENAFYIWSNSSISLGILDRIYALNPPNLIGEYYFGDSNMSANVGWVASGYAHAGWIGSIIYSVALSCVMLLLKTYGEKVGEKIVFATSFPLIFSLILSSDFVTALLTHGLAFYVLLIIFMPKENI
ncbi:hypothetical protein BCT78_04595 [Vibrio breoganii]|uniref:hypothetical protein n=1 Tax=Vibrio breoganii TaxID=553239 RepID=UPI000C84B58B|nr:hypothetical protein [Vibrio breoganii]PML38970.1 hypothetical protein BCT78_04595 [Vibrio breoganii]